MLFTKFIYVNISILVKIEEDVSVRVLPMKHNLCAVVRYIGRTLYNIYSMSIGATQWRNMSQQWYEVDWAGWAACRPASADAA